LTSETNIYRIREKSFLPGRTAHGTEKFIDIIPPDVTIDSDFRDVPIIYTVRPILTSILYNLISNAIKYRSPLRALQLKIKNNTGKWVCHAGGFG